jgi:hypothetical protein
MMARFALQSCHKQGPTMKVLSLYMIMSLCMAPAAVRADCASLVASMCDDDTAATGPQSRVIRLPPRAPAFAVGDVFPVQDHSLLMDPERYDLPPVDGPWRYYQVDFEVFRVDNATQRVLEVVTDGNRLMIR